MRRLQPKHHDHRYEDPPFRYKHRFLFVIRVHPYLVVAAKPIEKTIHVVTRDCIQYTICKQKGEVFRNDDSVQLPVVDAYSDFSVFLGYYDEVT